MDPTSLGEEIRSFGRIERRPAPTRDRVVAGLLLIGMLFAAAVLYRYNPLELGRLPKCPSYGTFGIYCPGCGSTRAVHHLLNARIVEAWRHNPALVLIGLPFLAMLLIQVAAVLFVGTHVSVKGSSRLAIALAVALVLYAIVRIIPFELFDGLRPPEASHAEGR